NPAPAFDSNPMSNYGMNNTNQTTTFDNNTFPGYGTNPAPQYNANPAQGYMQNPEFDTAAPKKKGVRWGLILGIGIPALVVLGSIICCIGFVIISALGVAGTSTPGTTNPISTPSTSTTTYTYERQDHARASVDDFDNQTSNASKNNDSTNGKNDVYLKSDYESTFGSNHTNHARDTFSGPYYEQFMDSFDTSYGYSVRRHFIDYEDQTSAGIDINGKMAYVEIKDNGKNIPNLDKLNKEIKNITLYDLTEYLKGNTSYGEISSIAFAVDSFCIYNDDVKMSILFESNIYPDQSQYYNYTHYVYTINIDLEKGEIIENDSIFKADDAMGQLFKDTNDAQNGYVEAVAELSVSEIADMLNDSSCNIVFFTPVGLEIGFNYYMVSGTDKSWGWVTISIEDYDQYLLDQKYKKNETACSSNGTPLTQADTENGVGVEDDGTQSGEDASEQSTEDGTGENGTDTEIPSVEVPSIEIPDFSDLIGEPETM
ncbi:MAG: hypothetical protein MJ119_06480, partial [Lachnospiraceae bacterium]|nr:hypothetical protein [Lachnospiraceae bacterium]